MSRTFSLLMVLVLLAGLLMAPVTAGAEVVVTDEAVAAQVRYSHRLIVELTSPPLALAEGFAQASAGGGKLDAGAPQAQAYVQKLQAEQASFVQSLQSAVPGARVATILNEQGKAIPATYQVLLNAVVVDAGRNADVALLEKQLRRLPGVARISKDYAHDPDLYASLELINVPSVWNNALVGGKANAGAGIKVASMDGGVHKDAPMFAGTGYNYPAGFPKGDTRNTNGKIIASRVYFRTWDPPAPGDENPWPGVNGTEHGVHTASTAAGNEVQASFLGSAPITLSGVAPKAYVMSYRVFYNSITGDGSFYNTEGIKALEDLVVDGADVVNNSWGGGPSSVGGEFDALDNALRNAVKAGVFVSMSNGNAGPGLGTGDHPSSDYINVAASQSGGTFASGRLKVTAPEPAPADMQFIGFGTALFGAPLPNGAVLGPYNYVPSIVADPTNAEGCKAFPAGAFAGKAALVIRGTCNFSLKALNAQNAGATFVVIYNQPASGDTLINMAAGTGAADVKISTVLVGNTNGKKLVEWYNKNGAAAAIALDTVAFQAGNAPDVLANFSSRGPGVGNVLKPDITAPGVNIMAQGYTPNASGEARHLGFGQASGTSMASPHVAGAAAMLRQIHPDWSPAWVKSALMSTSKYIGIKNFDGSPAQPLDMGAGRLDLTNAADPGVILDPPSLSFGPVDLGQVKTIEVMLTSVADTTETYAVSTLSTKKGFDALTTVDGMTVSPAQITLAPGGTAKLTVTWDTKLTSGEGDQQGFVVLKSAGHEAHLPAWMRVSYAPKPTVLEADLALAAGKDYSVVAAGELATIAPVVLDDTAFNTAPAAGAAKVRFVHLSPDAPNVDIAITGGAVLLPDVPFKGAKDGAVPAGTYDLEARVAGTSTVALALPGVKLDEGKLYTVFAMGKVVGPDGKKLQAVVVASDPLAPLAGKARVRVVHAVPDAPGVSVFVNDKIAFYDVMFKDVTAYAELAAGTYNIKVKPALGDVLVIDNDASTTLDLPDYTEYYTQTLDALGVTYEVWDADANFNKPATIPDANRLAQYKAIILQTGDNFSWNGRFTVVTPLTTLDMNRLVEYANAGGTILAFGQDLASATQGNTASAPFFYSATLGASYLQDSVSDEELFEDSAQLLTGVPGTPFSNTSFDISALGDGAANQAYIDEIAPSCSDPDFTLCPTQPLLKYSVGGNNVQEGYVALATRDNPTLERPGMSNPGRSLYFAFGLEGVNSDTGFNTRKDLLDAALKWGWDTAAVSIEATPAPMGQMSFFTAEMDSLYGGNGVTYRWDFGDGTAFTNSYKSATAGHTYTKPGSYHVRVEATNALGTKVIGETHVTIAGLYQTPATKVFTATGDTYIHSGLPTSNYGAAKVLTVGAWTNSGDFARALFQFDVTGIAPMYPVDKAMLWVWVDACGGGCTAADLRAYGVTKHWMENAATWKAPWAVKGGDITAAPAGSAPVTGASVGKWVKIDVTPLAAQWVADGMSNHGVMLRLANSTAFNTFRFVSTEHWNKDHAPKLEVTYRMP